MSYATTKETLTHIQICTRTTTRISWPTDKKTVGLTFSLVDSIGTTYYYVTNYREDVVRIVDAGGNSVADYSYDPWGIVTVDGSNAIRDQPIRYASYVHDVETNLYYLQARYYDPDNARFISRDSDGGTLDNPLSQNAYAYGNDDPVNNVDPDGQIVVAIPIIVGGALFLAAAGVLTVTQQEQMQKAATKVYAQFVGTAATVYVGYQVYKNTQDLIIKAQNNKTIKKKIKSLEEQIRKHEGKIGQEPNSRARNHWEKEIRNFKDQIDKLSKKLK